MDAAPRQMWEGSGEIRREGSLRGARRTGTDKVKDGSRINMKASEGELVHSASRRARSGGREIFFVRVARRRSCRRHGKDSHHFNAALTSSEKHVISL